MVMTSTRSLALTVATCAIYSCNTQSDVDALKLTSFQGIRRALSFGRNRRRTPTTTVGVDVDEETDRSRTTTSDSVSSPNDQEESPAVTKVFFDVDRYLKEQLFTKDQDGRYTKTKTTFLKQADQDLFVNPTKLWNEERLDIFDMEMEQDLSTDIVRKSKIVQGKTLFGKVMLYYVKVFKVKLEEYIENVVKDSSLGQQDLLLMDLEYTQYVSVGAKVIKNVAEEESELSKLSKLFGEKGVKVNKTLFCITDEGSDEKYYAVGDELTRVAHQLVFQMIKKITRKSPVSLDSLISIYTTATSSTH